MMPRPSFTLKNKRAIRLEIDAKTLFQNWVFSIESHFYEIFGVKYVGWIDAAKAKPLREKRIAELRAEDPKMTLKKARSIAVKTIRPMIYGWGLYKAETDDFAEGYLFKHRFDDYCVQLLGRADDGFILLFFDYAKGRYFKLADISQDDLFIFLQYGDLSLLQDRHPTRLPESGLKYEIAKHLKNK